MFTQGRFRSDQEVKNTQVNENATNLSSHRCFATAVLNRSIAPAPIVRPLISSLQACGFAL